MKTVHLIFNAHIDPVWLWPWSAGLDEVLNTCTSVCDLLDRHPEVVFTRGEAWVYQQIEIMSPALMKRIRAHMAAGRWQLVGGWYIQPDCNLPSRRGFERQIELGRKFFRSRFGKFPRTAFNVDSFGHAATLPDIMASYGQRNYVMMRPQEHEMDLPSRLFRWRGPEGGEVTTFRIAKAYCTSTGLMDDHVEAALTELPEGIDHTMCFVGVGDHGGGPTEVLVQWCLDNRDRFPGARLEFSSPDRFFKAIRRQTERLPVVEGELQHHAIGCYSVHRPVKLGLKRAETRLQQAEHALAEDRSLQRSHGAGLERAWEWACFTAFHDTLGGTCLPSAYRQVDGHVGAATCAADEVVCLRLRRLMAELPADPRQRLVVANWSGREFGDLVEHEPWLEWTEWQDDWVLRDETGTVVPHQLIAAEAVRDNMTRLLFPLQVAAGGHRVLRITRGEPMGRPAARGVKMTVGSNGELRLNRRGRRLRLPFLRLREDKTDTWSHGIDRFAERELPGVKWTDVACIETGPLREAWRSRGKIGRSRVELEWRFYPDHDHYDIILTVDWRERHRVLQLVCAPVGGIRSHTDGIPGGILQRDARGAERPLRDFTRIETRRGTPYGVVAPDAFSIAATGREVTLTLLRASVMAHHVPAPPQKIRRKFSDQGEHTLSFRIHPEEDLAIDTLEASALALGAPLSVGDLTHGMPFRPLRESTVGRV